jgi:hypothetical protein
MLAVRHADTTGNKSTLFYIKPTGTPVGLFVFRVARHDALMLGIPHASGKEVLSLPGGFSQEGGADGSGWAVIFPNSFATFRQKRGSSL